MYIPTQAYIDGLNVYYRLIKGTPYKWLDLEALLNYVLSDKYDLLKIKYFTTKVKAFPNNPQAPFRQSVYLEALKKHIPEIEIYYGSFLTKTKKRPLVNPIKRSNGTKISFAEVDEAEEKGSDVNLAVHLLNDAWLDKYQWAVVVSNDSDLKEALRLVREIGKRIILIPPFIKGKNYSKKVISPELLKYADKVKFIWESTLKKSLLPEIIPGTNLHRPQEW